MALTLAHNRMVAGAPVNVLDFGAVGDGVTDDTDAIQAAIDYAYANGGNVVYPATDAFYKINRCLICRPNVSHTGLGGYAKIKNTNLTPTATELLDYGVFLVGNFALQLTETLTQYDCGTISAGHTVTLTTAGDASNFAVGDQVITSSNAFTTFTIGGVTYKVFDYLHLNKVKAINGAVITLEYEIDVGYAGFLAKPSENNMSSTGASFVSTLPLYFCENAVFSNLDLESYGRNVFPGYNAAYNVTFTDCIMRGQKANAYGNTYQYCNFNNITSYFSDALGEYAQNSIYTTVNNCKFIYENSVSVASPNLRFQFGEACRFCRVNDSEIVLNDISVTAGFSMVVFGDAEKCEFKGNKVSGTNASSQIVYASFSGRTAGIRCKDNVFADNHIDVDSIRLWAYIIGVNNTNTGNVFANNKLYANSGDFAYSILVEDSYDNIISGNVTNYGFIEINDTLSSGNIITNNRAPQVFPNTTIDSATENYYRQNILLNNFSDDYLTKRAVLTSDITTTTAPAGVTTKVLDCNIGSSMKTRDSYKFRFFCLPTGTANTKLIEFILRDNTTATDLTIFSHTIAATFASSSITIKTELTVDLPADTIWCTTTVFEKSTATTTTYTNGIIRPASGNDLSFVLEATPGASTTVVFYRREGKVDNIYENGTW